MAHFTSRGSVDNRNLKFIDYSAAAAGWQFWSIGPDLVDMVRDPRASPGNLFLGPGSEIFRASGSFDAIWSDAVGDFVGVDGGLLYSLEYQWDRTEIGGPLVAWTITDLTADAALLVGATASDAPSIAAALFSGNDSVWGSDRADRLYGFGGNDEVFGGAGADFLDGGSGRDTLEGFTGADVYSVALRPDGSLQDRIVEIPLHAGVDTLQVTGTWTGTTSLRIGLPTGVENIDARGAGASLLDLGGDGQANLLVGTAGRNLLEGAAGNDTLVGDRGADVLRGGAGRDKLTGGAGADRFVFASASELSTSPASSDTISDFSRASGDRIDLVGIDADPATAGNQAFSFIGSTGFRAGLSTGKLRYVYDSATGTGMLQGSTDADSQPEFVIRLLGVPSLQAGDLML
jgi:Ca2+-binding RTX toxin-like protein